jgi:hypothetical protein
MQTNEITIPLELFDGRFSLEEIATISMIFASPNLSLKTREQWGGNPKCGEITDKLVQEGIIKFHDDKIEIDITEKQEPMNIHKQIENILGKYQIDQEDQNDINDLLETIGHESFGSGYEKGYDDGRIDFNEPSFTSYGNKEDYV